MTIKKVYDFLEGSEEGKALVDILRSAVKDTNDLEAQARTAKIAKDAAEEQLTKINPILDILKQNSLDENGIKELITKKNENLTVDEKVEARLKQLSLELDNVKGELKETKEAKTTLEKKEQKDGLKKQFSDVMKNIIPSALNDHLELKFASGELTYDSENKPVVEHGGKFYDPSSYWEVFKTERPDYVKGSKGPGNDPTNVDGKPPLDNKSMMDKTPAELLAMRYENNS